MDDQVQTIRGVEAKFMDNGYVSNGISLRRNKIQVRLLISLFYWTCRSKIDNENVSFEEERNLVGAICLEYSWVSFEQNNQYLSAWLSSTSNYTFQIVYTIYFVCSQTSCNLTQLTSRPRLQFSTTMHGYLFNIILEHLDIVVIIGSNCICTSPLSDTALRIGLPMDDRVKNSRRIFFQ